MNINFDVKYPVGTDLYLVICSAAFRPSLRMLPMTVTEIKIISYKDDKFQAIYVISCNDYDIDLDISGDVKDIEKDINQYITIFRPNSTCEKQDPEGEFEDNGEDFWYLFDDINLIKQKLHIWNNK